MAQFLVPEYITSSLAGQVAVLTGGANGIGAATVTRLVNLGAHVVFGDVDVAAATDLQAKLFSASGSATFKPCDVTNYDDLYDLFREAYSRHGRVDQAVANAGILEQGKWFDPELTIESVGSIKETTKVLDVNITAMANFARIAVVFLRDSLSRGLTRNPSLTLLASVASIRESPGLYMYQTSKHAVLGLMRSMRKTIFERDGVRVNTVCPGFTKSQMTEKIFPAFEEKDLARQTSDDVAIVILGVLASKSLNGKSMYVEGTKAWEFEDGVWNTMPQWLGEEPTKMLKENSEFVSSGALTRALEE